MQTASTGKHGASVKGLSSRGTDKVTKVHNYIVLDYFLYLVCLSYISYLYMLVSPIVIDLYPPPIIYLWDGIGMSPHETQSTTCYLQSLTLANACFLIPPSLPDL